MPSAHRTLTPGKARLRHCTVRTVTHPSVTHPMRYIPELDCFLSAETLRSVPKRSRVQFLRAGDVGNKSVVHSIVGEGHGRFLVLCLLHAPYPPGEGVARAATAIPEALLVGRTVGRRAPVVSLEVPAVPASSSVHRPPLALPTGR